jgi:hypothetical protein
MAREACAEEEVWYIGFGANNPCISNEGSDVATVIKFGF